MTLRSSYGELVPILVVAPAFFPFFAFPVTYFCSFFIFLILPRMRCYTIGPKPLFKFIFDIYPWRFHEKFSSFSMMCEAMIETLENISCLIKALAYCELLIIKFRYSEKAMKG